jgi:hypothetical protein
MSTTALPRNLSTAFTAYRISCNARRTISANRATAAIALRRIDAVRRASALGLGTRPAAL